MRIIKLFIKKAFERFGYKLLRSTAPSQDPFEDLQRLANASTTPIIFDVGAHHGHLSTRFRTLFPGSTVYAFEPFPDSFEHLRMNTSGDPSIKMFNFGFSNTEGPKQFSSNLSSVTNSLLETDDRSAVTWSPGYLETASRITVPFSTIDRFVEEMNIPAIDILKLDVQGAEYLVLEGAARSMAASRINLIYTEIIIQPTYKEQRELHEILRMFHEYGFMLYNLYNFSRTKDGTLRQVDAIFTHMEKKDETRERNAG